MAFSGSQRGALSNSQRGEPSNSSSKGGGNTLCSFTVITILILSNLLVLQISPLFWSSSDVNGESFVRSAMSLDELWGKIQQMPVGTSSTSAARTSTTTSRYNTQDDDSIPNAWNPLNPLAIPKGQAQNLPSVRVDDTKLDSVRKIYGGAGDKQHLGGFTQVDLQGISPSLWNKLITEVGVRSQVDIGCGRGISTLYFLEHGVDALCVEGSHDAVTKSFLPEDRIVEHDFARGPWWPEKTYDMAWSVEFLEHVSRQYHFNYMTVFRKAALIFVTSSKWGGWHHVEIHPDDWWIRKFELYGFKYEPELTTQVREWAKDGMSNKTLLDLSLEKQPHAAAHIRTSMKVFSNPMVAALPKHQHLFPRDGCFLKYADKTASFQSVTRPCGVGELAKGQVETPLPETFIPLKLTPDMFQRWYDTIKSGVKPLNDMNKKR